MKLENGKLSLEDLTNFILGVGDTAIQNLIIWETVITVLSNNEGIISDTDVIIKEAEKFSKSLKKLSKFIGEKFNDSVILDDLEQVLRDLKDNRENFKNFILEGDSEEDKIEDKVYDA